MKQEDLLIVDVTACYKNIDENNVSAILDVKRKDSEKFETVFKYNFSIDSLEQNSIEIYKDLTIPEIYNVYILSKNNPNYKGIFDIYFRVYQNELNNLRSFAKEKLDELNNPAQKEKESTISQIKDVTKKLWQELLEEGSTDELNGTIIRVAAYKKECPKEKLGEYADRCVIDIIRYKIDAWENIYSYEYGKYKIGGVLTDVNSASVYKKLTDDEIFKILSLLKTEEEYEVMKQYLKTVPKEPHGNQVSGKSEDQLKIENIKFL